MKPVEIKTFGEKGIYGCLWKPNPEADSKTPFVLLHEALGCVEIWRGFPENLARQTGRNVLAYDRVNYGKSKAELGERPLDYLEREAVFLQGLLEDLEREFGFRRPILFGHSDGASISLFHAILFDNISGMVLEAPHIRIDENTSSGLVSASRKEFWEPLKAKLLKYHGDKTEWLYQAWIKTWSNPAFRGCYVDDRLGQIQVPTLAIQGELDEYGKPEQVTSISDDCSGPAQSFLLPDCRHVPHLEMPQTVIDLTLNFIKTHFPD